MHKIYFVMADTLFCQISTRYTGMGIDDLLTMSLSAALQ